MVETIIAASVGVLVLLFFLPDHRAQRARRADKDKPLAKIRAGL